MSIFPIHMGIFSNPPTQINELIFTIDTSLGSGNTMVIPHDATETYLYDVDWGDTNTSTAQTGSASHTYSSGGIYQITITGTFPKFYFNDGGDKLKITSIDNWGSVGYSTSQRFAFAGCSNLSSLAEDMAWINSVTDGVECFIDCSFATIPSVVTLESLTNGNNMFQFNGALTSIENLNFDNLLLARRMFRSCNSLVTNVSAGVWANITDGRQMFDGCNITTIPSTVTLVGIAGAFGLAMFRNCTINTADYSQLINNIDANNANTGVTFDGGNSTYNSSAQTSHDNLTITKSWSITDGGLV